LLPVLREHFVELDVLWERRELCVFDPVWRPRDLAELEQRAHRHLEGLLLGQGHALDLAREAFRAEERGAATAAGFVFLDLGVPELRDELMEILSAADLEVAHGIRIALRHRTLGSIEPAIRTLADSGSPIVKACACDVLAFHRSDPVVGVRSLLEEEDEELRTLAISSIGRWRGEWGEGDLLRELEKPDSKRAQRAALETSARLSLPGLPSICLEAAFEAEEPCMEAMKFLGVIGGVSELPRLEKALENPDLATPALGAIGALGSPDGIPAIIEALRDPKLMHDAAAAFLRITAAENVKGDPVPPPEDFSEEEADFWDEHVEVDADLAEKWWEAHEAEFYGAERWQNGQAVSGWPVDGDLTLEARRDEYLRGSFQGVAGTEEVELERRQLPSR